MILRYNKQNLAKDLILSRKERLKVRLDYLKTLIFTCIAGIFGIVGYVAINFGNISFGLGIAVFSGFVLLALIVFFANRAFDKRLDKLEKMELVCF